MTRAFVPVIHSAEIKIGQHQRADRDGAERERDGHARREEGQKRHENDEADFQRAHAAASGARILAISASPWISSIPMPSGSGRSGIHSGIAATVSVVQPFDAAS